MEARIKDAIRSISETIERVECQQQAMENELDGASGLAPTLGYLKAARTTAKKLLRQVRNEPEDTE